MWRRVIRKIECIARAIAKMPTDLEVAVVDNPVNERRGQRVDPKPNPAFVLARPG